MFNLQVKRLLCCLLLIATSVLIYSTYLINPYVIINSTDSNINHQSNASNTMNYINNQPPKQQLYSFGNYNSIHLIRDSCINPNGIFYLQKQNIINVSKLLIHTDLWSAFSNIQLYPINNSNNNITFSDKIGFLLWTSNLQNFYHFIFSLIGGYKALKLINKSTINIDINLNNIQLIYFGCYPSDGFKFNKLQSMYNNVISNISKNKPLQLKQLHKNTETCFKQLIVGRASHWEIYPDDFSSLSHQLNELYSESDELRNNNNNNIENYIKCGKDNKYLNIMILQRKYPRRYIINTQQIKTQLINTFNQMHMASTNQIKIFKKTRFKYFSPRFFNNISETETLKINVIILEFEDMEIIEQFKLIYNTDILISSHGAGLTWSLFMSPQSYIIEIIPNGSTGQCDECDHEVEIESSNNYYKRSWSTFTEISQWRRNHHICVHNDIVNKLIKQNFKINVGWMDLPYLVSNSTLNQMINVLWKEQFGTIINNDDRKFCMNKCLKYLLKQNWRGCKKYSKNFYIEL